jgi:DNA replication protein DnaC
MEVIRAHEWARIISSLVDEVVRATPPAYRGRELHPALVDFAQSFDGRQWLVLQGDPGVGKTTQVWTLIRVLAEQGKLIYPTTSVVGWTARTVAAWSVPEWLARVRSTYSNNQEPPDLSTPWLLFLDDLGAERIRRDTDGDSHVREQMFGLVNDRWEWRKPTIFTTNLSAVKIAERLDERIADRIFDRTLTTVMTLPGESWRRKG